MIEQYDLLWLVTDDTTLVDTVNQRPSLWNYVVAIDKDGAQETTRLLELNKQKREKQLLFI